MTSTLDYTALAERRVREQLIRGDRFADIERYIDRLELDGDLKGAIWMLAWAELPFHQRREIIMQTAKDRRGESEALHAQAAQASRQSAKLTRIAKLTGRGRP